MKSTASGRSIFRARSPMKRKAPFRTPTRTSSLSWWSASISLARSATRAAICCSETSTSSSAASFIGWSPSYVSVVHQLAESAAARHDVLLVVQSALRVPERSRNGIEDLRRREPAIEPEGVHDDAGMLRRDAADVFRRDDEVGGDGLAR